MEAKRIDEYTQEQIDAAQRVVAAYNKATGSCTRYKQPENIAAVAACLTFASAHGKTIRDVTASANVYAEDMGRDLVVMSLQSFCAWYRAFAKRPAATAAPAAPKAEVTPVKAESTSTPTAAADINGALGMIVNAVAKQVAEVKAEDIQRNLEDHVREFVEDHVREFVAKEYGTITRKIEFDINGVKATPQGITHEKFETVLKFAMADEPVFLTGAAGSGKNVLCKQIAESLGLDFYFTNAVTQEYKLTGFTDAMGTFHESQFYKAFKDGGLFMLDEMDASIPEVLIILNAAIANRYFDFPAPIGYVEAHKDFRIIAAGNTVGLGADSEYVGRCQLDAASLDRFAIVKIDYCEAVEEACANGDQELVSFCRAFRNATKNAGVQCIVSYRSISRIAKMKTVMDIKTVLQTCLIKGMEKSDLDVIKGELQEGFGEYSKAFKKIVREVA